MMRKTNSSISDEEVSKIISEVDLDGDGTINFDGKPVLSQSLMSMRALINNPPEFITMMTGQPYKSPEAAGPAAGESGEQVQTDGMPSTSVAAVRGVSTVSARLHRQRLANQVFKDAWMVIDPTLKGSITAGELLDKVAPRAGLDMTDADLQEMVDPSANQDGRITCEQCWSLTCAAGNAWSANSDNKWKQTTSFSRLQSGRKSMIL